MTEKTIRIAGAQGFYGDSPQAAMNIVMERGADYLMHDALAELTLSILQKDRQQDPSLGYARDIELMAHTLFPAAFGSGIKIVTNSGGLNPHSAVKKVSEILARQGLKGIKIATIIGDDMLERLPELQQAGLQLEHFDTGAPFSSSKLPVTHANVYIGAKSVKEALDKGAHLILAGRVADPCLTLGILAHEFNWQLDGNLSQSELDKLACGIAIGHVIECGGQASGGNSYAEWPMDYPLHNLGYPIAHVKEDGSAVFTKLESQGGKVSRNTIREQLVYEIHDPANYITPDVIADLTQIELKDIAPNRVSFKGARGKPRPEKLKLAIGQMSGYISEQFFFFSHPYAYEKCVKFIDAVKKIWASLPLQIERSEFSIVGVNGIHGNAAPQPSKEWLEQANELGVRVVLKHNDERTGRMAMMSITCLGLNGPPGVNSMPGWGKTGRVKLSLWPTLIPREVVQEKVEIYEVAS
ncbi:MAG TPA: acyclic terpene utilization AtuA family protein [Chitinophagales bacterium]|nr:acyclic terpene utilization AtuA family protein [Chitinophagales bacterium]